MVSRSDRVCEALYEACVGVTGDGWAGLLKRAAILGKRQNVNAFLEEV